MGVHRVCCGEPSLRRPLGADPGRDSDRASNRQPQRRQQQRLEMEQRQREKLTQSKQRKRQEEEERQLADAVRRAEVVSERRCSSSSSSSSWMQSWPGSACLVLEQHPGSRKLGCGAASRELLPANLLPHQLPPCRSAPTCCASWAAALLARWRSGWQARPACRWWTLMRDC